MGLWANAAFVLKNTDETYTTSKTSQPIISPFEAAPTPTPITTHPTPIPTQAPPQSPAPIINPTPITSPIPTPMPTPTSQPSLTPTPTMSQNPTPKPSLTTTPTPTPTPTPSRTPAPNPTITPTPSPTATSTPQPTPPITPTPSPIPLSTAISSGYVIASFTGSGGCCGDCIYLTIQRTVSYTIEIMPPSLGTQLVTSGDTQNMVLYKLDGIDKGGGTYQPTSSIVLANSNKVVYLFSAYCINAHKSNPQSSTQFTMAGTASTDVIKTLNALGSISSSVSNIAAVQTAIWVITDNISRDELQSIFPDGINQISNARTILTTAGIDISGKLLFS